MRRALFFFPAAARQVLSFSSATILLARPSLVARVPAPAGLARSVVFVSMPSSSRPKRARAAPVNYNVDQYFRDIECDGESGSGEGGAAAGGGAGGGGAAPSPSSPRQSAAVPAKKRTRVKKESASAAANPVAVKNELTPLKVEQQPASASAAAAAGARVRPDTAPLPRRRDDGTLSFAGHPDFTPNLAPYQVLQLGSFGGTYWRRIRSGVTGRSYEGAHAEFPASWCVRVR
jgi:hypothetical protein